MLNILKFVVFFFFKNTSFFGSRNFQFYLILCFSRKKKRKQVKNKNKNKNNKMDKLNKFKVTHIKYIILKTIKIN